MDLTKEKDIIKQLQKCQRNWDYSKTIPEEHLELRVDTCQMQI